MHIRHRPGFLCAVSLIGGIWSAAATAQDLPALDRFRVSVGAYHSQNDVDIRSDRGEFQGSEVNFHRDLGFDDNQTGLVWNLAATPFRHHQLSAFGYRYDSDADKTLSQDFVIDGETFSASATFTGDLDIAVSGVAYTWFFHHSEHKAFGIGLGAVRYDVESDLFAILAAEGTVQTASAGIEEDAWAPLLRAEYTHVLHPRWRLNIEAAAVRKPSGSISGTAIDAGIALGWYPWRHFGFVARYNYNDIDLDLDKSSYSGDIDIRNSGPQILLSARF